MEGGGGDGGEAALGKHFEEVAELFLIILFLQWPISDTADSGRPSINPSPGSVVAMGQALCKGLKDQIESLPDTFLLHPLLAPHRALCS